MTSYGDELKIGKSMTIGDGGILTKGKIRCLNTDPESITTLGGIGANAGLISCKDLNCGGTNQFGNLVADATGVGFHGSQVGLVQQPGGAVITGIANVPGTFATGYLAPGAAYSETNVTQNFHCIAIQLAAIHGALFRYGLINYTNPP